MVRRYHESAVQPLKNADIVDENFALKHKDDDRFDVSFDEKNAESETAPEVENGPELEKAESEPAPNPDEGDLVYDFEAAKASSEAESQAKAAELLKKMNEDAGVATPPPAEGVIEFNTLTHEVPKTTRAISSRAPSTRRATPPPIPAESRATPPPLPPEAAPLPPPLGDAERLARGLPPLEAPGMRHSIPIPPPMPAEAIPVPPPLPPEAAPVPPPIPDVFPPERATPFVLPEAVKRPSAARRALGAIGSFLSSPFKKAAGALGAGYERRILIADMKEANGSVQDNLVRVEKAKAQYGQADASVKALESQLATLNGLAAPATPKEAVARQKSKNQLESQLSKAQMDKEKRLLIVNTAEARTINHENKRAEIARQYAEVVDRRLAPTVGARDSLNLEKQAHENELATWQSAVSGYRMQIDQLLLSARDNPALHSTFRLQIKEAQRLLGKSENEVKERIAGLSRIDARLTRTNAIISKWDLKKKGYQDMADKRMFRSHLDPNTPLDTVSAAGFRDPVNRPEGDPIAEEAEATEEAGAAFERREALSTQFGFKEWVKGWNDMHGSKLELDFDKMMDAMQDQDVANNYRNNPPALTAALFSKAVKGYLVDHKNRTGTALSGDMSQKKIIDLNKLTLTQLQKEEAARSSL